MSDIVIDLRPRTGRKAKEAALLLRYYQDMRVDVFENDEFALVISRADSWDIWAPYGRRGVFLAVGGRIALESDQWDAAKAIEGEGGVACKALYRMYSAGGINALTDLNGSFAAVVWDEPIRKLYIVTDRCGMYPCFHAHCSDGHFVIGSHPDVVARVSGCDEKWDKTSVSEFIITGKLSFPYTYYENVTALDYGAIHAIALDDVKATFVHSAKYFSFDYKPDYNAKELDLAVELSQAFRNAMRRRTLPMLGKTGISLSGGLDSRTLLCSVAGVKDDLLTFCFFDEENLEFRTAKAIAAAAGSRFLALKRPFDHYGDNSEEGVKISGGMGDFSNNHYLGFRERFIDAGIDNVISGFYCDYLFKGLALNKKQDKVLRMDKYVAFSYQHYKSLFWLDTIYRNAVIGRLENLFPDELRRDITDMGRLRVEARRIFPLSYEPDNQETIVPQRVMGFFLPAIDNDIIDIYLKVPAKYKLNASMYSKMVQLQCGDEISRIINKNTGARVTAGRIELMWHKNINAVLRRVAGMRPRMSTDNSWPNWEYYIHNSEKVRALWVRKNDAAEDLLAEVTGENLLMRNPSEFRKSEVELFLRLLTVKLWVDGRASCI